MTPLGTRLHSLLGSLRFRLLAATLLGLSLALVLAGFPFVEESFESPVAQPPGDRLECGKGAHRQGCGLTGILERGVAGISTDGAAFFQQSGITHFRFLTIPRKGVPQSLGQGHPEMEDMARVGSEGIHGAQAETDWEAVAPRAVP